MDRSQRYEEMFDHTHHFARPIRLAFSSPSYLRSCSDGHAHRLRIQLRVLASMPQFLMESARYLALFELSFFYTAPACASCTIGGSTSFASRAFLHSELCARKEGFPLRNEKKF